MTSKNYFRNLALHDLGIPTDDRLLKMHDLFTERFSNLKKFRSVISINIIFYGKSKDDFVLSYYIDNGNVMFFYDTFIKKITEDDYYNMFDIFSILIKYTDMYLGIKTSTYVDWSYHKVNEYITIQID